MDTKELITKAAFQHFLTKGYRNTSMDDLVNSTKLSKGAFYHHFISKEEIYQTVVESYFLSYYRNIDWSDSEKLSVKEIEQKIKEFYNSFVPEIARITEKGISRYFTMFFEAYTIYPEFKETTRNIYNLIKSVLTAAFIKENSTNPELDALKVITKYEGLLFWFALYPEEKMKKMIDEI